MPRPKKVTRVSKATREKIVKAAARAFAREGYEGASIRAIVADAEVNQAAINYHFGSKEGLYRAVLQTALRALMSDDDAPQSAKLSREAALRRFARRHLRPMTARDELSDYARIFSWETLRPSPVFRKFMAREVAPFLAASPSWFVAFCPAKRRTRKPSSARCGCSDKVASSCATPSSLPTRRFSSRSTSDSWTSLPIRSRAGQRTASVGAQPRRGYVPCARRPSSKWLLQCEVPQPAPFFRRRPGAAQFHARAAGANFPQICHASFSFPPRSCLKRMFENQSIV